MAATIESPPILVVGSANADLVFECDHIPRAGETLAALKFSTHPGGKGANQAVAIGRLGGNVSFLGCVGNDSSGEMLAESLRSAGVKLDYLDRGAAPTGTAGIVVDRDGQNSIVVAPGANAELTPARVRAALTSTKAEVALAQLEIPLDAVEAAAQASFFILNPAPARALPDAIIAACEVLIPNEIEIEMLTGISTAEDEDCLRAGLELLGRGAKNVIITRGHLGSYWVSQTGGQPFPAPRVDVVDTTAAGDAFNGALALFLAQDRDMANAIALANCAGALATTKRGAQESMPTLEELKAFAGNLW